MSCDSVTEIIQRRGWIDMAGSEVELILGLHLQQHLTLLEATLTAANKSMKQDLTLFGSTLGKVEACIEEAHPSGTGHRYAFQGISTRCT